MPENKRMLEREEERPLDERFLQGISTKIIVWIVVGTISICTTVLTTYFSFKTQIANTQIILQTLTTRLDGDNSDNRQRDIQIREIQLRLTVLETQMSELQTKKK